MEPARRFWGRRPFTVVKIFLPCRGDCGPRRDLCWRLWRAARMWRPRRFAGGARVALAGGNWRRWGRSGCVGAQGSMRGGAWVLCGEGWVDVAVLSPCHPVAMAAGRRELWRQGVALPRRGAARRGVGARRLAGDNRYMGGHGRVRAEFFSLGARPIHWGM